MGQLNEIFEELRAAGIVRTKREFADALGINYTGLIAAMGGQRVTPSLVAKAVRFRNDHLDGGAPAAEPPQPDAKEAALDRLLTNMMDAHQIAMKTLEQNDRLIALLELEAKARAGVSPAVQQVGKNAGQIND